MKAAMNNKTLTNTAKKFLGVTLLVAVIATPAIAQHGDGSGQMHGQGTETVDNQQRRGHGKLQKMIKVLGLNEQQQSDI